MQCLMHLHFSSALLALHMRTLIIENPFHTYNVERLYLLQQNKKNYRFIRH